MPVAPSNTTPVRETTTTSQTFTNSLGSTFTRPQSVVTYGGGTKIAETDYGYDGAQLVPVASTTQHDETNFGPSLVTSRGNPTQEVRWNSVGVSPSTTYVYDETGQIRSMTDPCGNATCSDVSGSSHSTTYSYADNYSSGLPAGNTNAYPTTVTDAAGHTTNRAYDLASGQMTSIKDGNAQTTLYKYNTPPLRMLYTRRS